MHFLIGLFVLLSLSFERQLYNLDSSPLSDVSFANTFSQSVACLLVPLSIVIFRGGVRVRGEVWPRLTWVPRASTCSPASSRVTTSQLI